MGGTALGAMALGLARRTSHPEKSVLRSVLRWPRCWTMGSPS